MFSNYNKCALNVLFQAIQTKSKLKQTTEITNCILVLNVLLFFKTEDPEFMYGYILCDQNILK